MKYLKLLTPMPISRLGLSAVSLRATTVTATIRRE